MRLNRQTANQKTITTCPDFIQALKGAFIFDGEILFNLEGENAPNQDECTQFLDVFTIRAVGEIDGFQVLKAHLKSGVLRACDGEEEGQDNVHLLTLAGTQLTEMFRNEGVSASMSLSETNDGTNYPGIYIYVVPQGMTYRGYLKKLSERKAEEGGTETQTSQSRPSWSNRRQSRWGGNK